jgi:hypothetical protein
VVAGIGLGLAAGLLLVLAAEDRPMRVIGVLVLAVNLLMVPASLAVFRVQLPSRQRSR